MQKAVFPRNALEVQRNAHAETRLGAIVGVNRLQQRALGRKMGGQIPCDRDKDVSALVAVLRFAKLLHTRLEDLVGTKSCILSKQCMPEGGDQRLWRVTEDKVAGNQARRGVDLLLAVEGIEQSSPDSSTEMGRSSRPSLPSPGNEAGGTFRY